MQLFFRKELRPLFDSVPQQLTDAGCQAHRICVSMRTAARHAHAEPWGMLPRLFTGEITGDALLKSEPDHLMRGDGTIQPSANESPEPAHDPHAIG